MPQNRLFRVEECEPPYELVKVAPSGDALLPEAFRDKIFIHTVHDGDIIPERYICDEHGKPRVDLDELESRFIEERDWGANLVANRIAGAMGIGVYGKVRLARVLMDFNRFPGSTPHDDTIRPLERLAINHPFSVTLGHPDKIKLLMDQYDRISATVEDHFGKSKLITIAIHTYDEHNPTRTRRPHLSLLSSVAGYQRESRMPFGIFDPLYPDILGEATCSRILRDRISLNLERTGFRLSHNHPYPLPEGSMEVRAQVWFFFCYLRKRFEDDHPDTQADPAFARVWLMLLNTNLRLAEAEALRSYIHRFRKLPARDVKRYNEARMAYDAVGDYLKKSNIVDDFRHSKNRPSSLGLEVRKDLVASLRPDNGRPDPVTEEQLKKASLIGTVIADAISTYLETDLQYL